MSEIKQKIPARLESAVKGGYVTGAKDIVDDALGKAQSVVNEEHEEAISDLQENVGTGGSVDERINAEKTRASNAEQGLDTRLNVVEQLAEISVGGGDIGIGTAADFESDDPEDLAKVPTVGAMLGGANDGVYDISARHNGTKYADFTAALGTDGANIPEGLRRGGMSIKFVHSSDNKYVQYRYMNSSTAVADFIKVANWQGVDDEPVAGSDNLVKSGGVVERFVKIDGVIDNGTTYSKKDSTNRVNVYYDIPNVDAVYKIKVSDVFIDDNSNYVFISLRSGKTPYSDTNLRNIGTYILNGGSLEIAFSIPDELKESAKYISVCQQNAYIDVSYKVELSIVNDSFIDTKIDNNTLNNVINLKTYGSGTTAKYLHFKTVIGCKYIISFPKVWTCDFSSTAALAVLQLRKADETTIVDTVITKGTLGNRPNHYMFDAEETEYSLFIRADVGQMLMFDVYPVGDNTLSNVVKELRRHNQRIDYLDNGETVYDEKYTTPTGIFTNRTCVFYEIGDVNSSFRIKLRHIIIPENNRIEITITSDKSPYDMEELYLVDTITSDSVHSVEFYIPDNVKSAAKYISVHQVGADESLCQFSVELYSLDCLQYDVNKIQGTLNNILYIDKGETAYNEKYLTTNRTCKFYPLVNVDKNKEFYIRIFDTIVSGASIRVFIAKKASPYDAEGNNLQLIGSVSNSGKELEKTFSLSDNAKMLGNYIAVCQTSADSNLCEFKVILGYNDCLERKIDNVDDKDSDVIPYNDSLFVSGRTLKIYNPYKNGGNNQYAGQMHCHSWGYATYDGIMYKVPIGYTVEQVAAMTEDERTALVLSVNQQFVQAHKTVGYSFMTITNYDVFADYTSAPAQMPENFIWLGDGFEGSVGGWDSTAQSEDQGAHMNVFNTNFGKRFAGWTRQELLDYCEDRNCIVTYNHPFLNMIYSSPAYVRQIKKRLRFIEVYNGLGVLHADVDGIPFIKPGIMLDEDFDALISQGNFTFATGVSDERSLVTGGTSLRHGCIKVFANELSHKSIIEALLNGNFYAVSLLSDAVKINGVIVENGQYKVDVGLEDVTVEFLGKDNTILSTVTTSSGNMIATYNLTGTEMFVRARLYKLNSNPYDADFWHKNKEWIIWTQPIFIAKEFL